MLARSRGAAARQPIQFTLNLVDVSHVRILSVKVIPHPILSHPMYMGEVSDRNTSTNFPDFRVTNNTSTWQWAVSPAILPRGAFVSDIL